MHSWELAVLAGAICGCALAQEAVVISPSFAVEGRIVKGVPYSATANTTVKQTLATGSEIDTHFNAMVARDSEGRTRREQTIRAIGPWSVEPGQSPTVVVIFDPVKGLSYSLNPAAHTAKITRVSPLPEELMRQEPGRKDPVRSEPNREEPRTGRTESLGTQMIEGVMSQGRRTVTRVPRGEMGNSAPLELVVETWYSPELQVVVLGKRNDPRVGEITYRLTNIKRTEPANSLFEVPADYRIEGEGKASELERRKKENEQ